MVADRSDVPSVRALAATAARAASAIPIAAATPIAGAPRTTMSRMAAATSSTLVQRANTTSPGKRRWSSRTSAPSSSAMWAITTRSLQLLLQHVVDDRGIALALHLLHHLADEKPKE